MLYEGGVRIPMAIRWPGQTKPGGRFATPVSLIDLYPTILGIAGVAAPAGQPVDGVSLVPALEGFPMPALEGRRLFWYDVKSQVLPDGELLLPAAAIRKGSWKLMRFFGKSDELYHLDSDPSEARNRADTEVEMARTMNRELDEWLDRTGIVLPAANPDFDPDFLVPRQVDHKSSETAKPVREWSGAAFGNAWKKSRMCEIEATPDGVRIRARGVYPEIMTGAVFGLPPARYLISVRLRTTAGGRIRFGWSGENSEQGIIEFFPERTGEWHTLIGRFEVKSPLKAFRLAGPTHLETAGYHDPATQRDFVEIAEITLSRPSGP
jgi:hypothetical protein